MQMTVRPPAVAGQFYPADPAELRADLRRLLYEAAPRESPPAPKALIAPHAGYVYSGPVAATAYARLAPLRDRIATVVLLGPTHRVAVDGLALPGVDRFATPLGEVDVDAEAVASIVDLPQVVVSPKAHALEHALEVHLPFLVATLGRFRLVPLAVGKASPEAVAEVLDRLWGGPDTLVVVSSDLSHYLPYATARRMDEATVRRMLAFAHDIDPHEACGAAPVNGLLLAAQRRGLGAELLDLRNSGDTAGDKSRVVGYASIGLFEGRAAAQQDDDENARGRTLVRLARAAIARQLGRDQRVCADAPWLQAPGAVFVTLHKHGALRGCIGSLEARRPLREDVEKNARSAAFLDPRFTPLSLRELDDVEVEVSLLSPAEPLRFKDEADLLRQMRPGVDGLILEQGPHRGTFLPQVWDQLPAPADFLAHLKRKAGLPADFWSADLRVSRYTVRKWSENA